MARKRNLKRMVDEAMVNLAVNHAQSAAFETLLRALSDRGITYVVKARVGNTVNRPTFWDRFKKKQNVYDRDDAALSLELHHPTSGGRINVELLVDDDGRPTMFMWTAFELKKTTKNTERGDRDADLRSTAHMLMHAGIRDTMGYDEVLTGLLEECQRLGYGRKQAMAEGLNIEFDAFARVLAPLWPNNSGQRPSGRWIFVTFTGNRPDVITVGCTPDMQIWNVRRILNPNDPTRFETIANGGHQHVIFDLQRFMDSMMMRGLTEDLAGLAGQAGQVDSILKSLGWVMTSKSPTRYGISTDYGDYTLEFGPDGWLINDEDDGAPTTIAKGKTASDLLAFLKNNRAKFYNGGPSETVHEVARSIVDRVLSRM